MLLPCRTKLPKAPARLPGSLICFFLLGYLCMGQRGSWGSSVWLESLVFQRGGGRGRSWGRTELGSLPASSEKPPRVAADSHGEPSSPEPLHLGLTVHRVSLVPSRLSHHPGLAFSFS